MSAPNVVSSSVGLRKESISLSKGGDLHIDG